MVRDLPFGRIVLGWCLLVSSLFLLRETESLAASALDLPNGKKIVEARLLLPADQVDLQVIEASKYTTYVAAELLSATVQGQVWKDANYDGQHQLSDPFIPNTVVRLYALAEGEPQPSPLLTTPLVTTTTTITGWYQLANLAPGSYALDFVTPGAMYPTLPNQGDDETTDSDISYAGQGLIGRYSPLLLTDTEASVDIDAGFVAAAQLTVYVYEDSNQDNVRQPGEPEVPDAEVLLAAGDEVIRRLRADETGAVWFTDLLPAAYSIQIVPPAGYTVKEAIPLTPSPLPPGSSTRFAAPVFQIPTALRLVDFVVALTENRLLVRWTTAAEYNTYGFRVMRQDPAAADLIALTAELVASQGGLGGSYSLEFAYNPADDPPYAMMNFWLVEYTTTGKENPYGPFRIAQPPNTTLFLPLVRQPDGQ